MSGLMAPRTRTQNFCQKKNMDGVNEMEQSVNKCEE